MPDRNAEARLLALADDLVDERRELQNTARDMSAWRARTDEILSQLARHVEKQNGSVQAIEHDISEIKVSVAVTRTKIAIYSTMGSLIGAGVVSWLFSGGLG